MVELDDAFFGAPTEGGKRDRGTEQIPVLAAVSLDKKGPPQYVKKKVIPNVKGMTLVDLLHGTISSAAPRSAAMPTVHIENLQRKDTITSRLSLS